MPFCPACGKEVLPGEAFCLNCGAPLPRNALQRTTGGTDSQAQAGAEGKEKRGWLGIVLSSILPGLGQYYFGQRTKGRIFIVIAVALALASVVLGLELLYLLFWLYSMIDEFVTVKKAETGRPLPNLYRPINTG
jgi:hypothetical protein